MFSGPQTSTAGWLQTILASDLQGLGEVLGFLQSLPFSWVYLELPLLFAVSFTCLSAVFWCLGPVLPVL